MPWIPAKLIARIHATSDSLEELSWEWLLRADWQVSYRLTAVGGQWGAQPVDNSGPAARHGLTGPGRARRRPGRCWRASPTVTGIRPTGHGDSYPTGAPRPARASARFR